MNRVAFIGMWLLLLCFRTYPQGETNVWYFGANAGIDFNSGSPVALTNGALSTSEGCATIADKYGNLLFYTDGIKVWTRAHVQMPNGFGLMGDPSSAQSAIIVPKPGSTTFFYLFTVDNEGGPNGLRYSEVDLTLNGGLGDVVAATKNTPLFTPSAEKITAVKHASGIDVWVLAHGLYNNRYYAYLVDCNGVNAPVISHAGSVEGWPGWGYLTASPDGKKLASAMRAVGFELLDFDNATGVVSNPLFLGYAGECYGVSFSPNNKVLYGLKIGNGEIYQWNLQAGTPAAIAASAVFLGYAMGTDAPYRGGALQLGPDGRLYVCQFQQPFLSVINYPDVVGTGCNLQFNAVSLAGRNCILGLPPFIQSYFDTTAVIQYAGNCPGRPVSFSISSSIAYLDSVKWDFGDIASGAQNFSTSLFPSHIFAASGNYNVRLIRYLSCVSDTNYKQVSIIPSPTFLQDAYICPGNSFTLPGGRVVTTPGIFYDTLAAATPCDSIIITQIILGSTDITASNDTAICLGGSVQLNASGGMFTYSWSPSAGLDNPNIPNPVATPAHTTSYVVTTQVFADELIVNGDFNAGNAGFISGYVNQTNLFPEGTYYVGSNPNAYHSGFTACSDHTGGGNMMIVNGSGTPGVNVWCQSISVVPNTDYAFSCWVTSVVAGSPALLQFSINGALLGSLFSAPPMVCPWQQFYVIWNSGSNTSANICIVNQNTTLGGNDFALDDISFIGLCPARDTVTITVINPAYATIDTSICQGTSYTFPDGSVSSVSDTNISMLTGRAGCDSIITTYLTVMPSGSTAVMDTICSGASYPLPDGSIVTASGSYPVTLPNQFGCDSIIITHLTVIHLAAHVQPVDVLCNGDSTGRIAVTAAGGIMPFNFNLLQNGNVISVNHTGNFTALPAGDYVVNITDNFGCPISSSVRVNEPVPLQTLLDFESISCHGENDGEIILTAAGGTPGYTFSITNQPPNTMGIFTGLEAGTYGYTVTDKNNCTINGSATLTEPQPVIITVSPGTAEIKLGETVRFNATSNYDPGATYLWTPADALDCTHCSNPISTTLSSIVYNLEVTAAVNGKACKSAVDVAVTVLLDHDLQIPNAFSPNGDGYNDFFRIYGNLYSVKTLEVMIFDRSGEKVFQSNDINFQWDGTYAGEKLFPNVFVYSIRATYIDNFTPKLYKGSVTLLK